MSDSAVRALAARAAGATGAAAAALAAEAAAHPGVFAFAEILDVPGMQALANTEHEPALSLLKLFAYGTWADYRAARASGSPALPPLDAAAERKLRQLTVVSLAERSAELTYDELQATLEIGSTRELEDLLINECMYTGLVRGTLDQQRRMFHVRGCAGRDVPRESLKDIVAGLERWEANTGALLQTIEQSAASVKASSDAAARAEKELEAKKESVRKEAEERGGGGSGARARQGWAGGAHESFDSMPVAMELTEDDRAGRMKRRR